MFSALDINNNLVDIDRAIKEPLNKYFCTSCKREVIMKNGNVRISHFAHKNKCDCDDYNNDISEWHRNWQKKFPIKNREVVLKINENDPFIENFNKTVRRADVLCYGYVIEFQNSPISSEEFNDRNYFYTRLGKKVVWIFNMVDEYDNEKITHIQEWENNFDNGGKYKWKYASKTFINYDSYDKDVILIFQFSDVSNEEEDREQCYFERVVWAINSRNDEYTNFKHFCTSYYPRNFTELMDKIKRRKL